MTKREAVEPIHTSKYSGRRWRESARSNGCLTPDFQQIRGRPTPVPDQGSGVPRHDECFRCKCSINNGHVFRSWMKLCALKLLAPSTSIYYIQKDSCNASSNMPTLSIAFFFFALQCPRSQTGGILNQGQEASGRRNVACGPRGFKLVYMKRTGMSGTSQGRDSLLINHAQKKEMHGVAFQ